MKLILSCIACFYLNVVFAQKQLIDSNAYREWPTLGNHVTISNDGNFVSYRINGLPVKSHTIIVQSIDGKWKKELIGQSNGVFSKNSRYLYFIKGKDSLAKLTNGGSRIRYTPGISSFTLNTFKNAEWLCYRLSGKSNTLVLENTNGNVKWFYEDVVNWKFSEDGSILVLNKLLFGTNKTTLNWINLTKGEALKIWEGAGMDNLILDQKHHQLSFKSPDSIWYFKQGLISAKGIAESSLKGISDERILASINNFSKDGRRLFVNLKEREKAMPIAGSLEIWNYRDEKLQPEQELELGPKIYLAVVDLASFKVTPIQNNPWDFFYFPNSPDASDSLAIVETTECIAQKWSIKGKTIWSLVSTVNGKRKVLDSLASFFTMSYNGKFLIYYNTHSQDYFSYEIATSKVRNLTQGLNVSWKELQRDDITINKAARMHSVWLEGDQAVLVYDSYDIWELDPLNIRKPVNVTNGYGKRNQIIFNFAFDEVNIKREAKIYLTAFNTENKNNGFYSKQIDKLGDPELLTMDPYIFCSNSGYNSILESDFSPVKAKVANSYIVRRMSATEAPNYYSTKDFTVFKAISNLHPQRKYNWYTTELHTWKSLDGRTLKGILYKPENFDPEKKYPVIFHYYERKSDALNAFIKPETLCAGCNINIPSYVSQGYLVFTPDIYYNIGDPMQGTYDAVVSAAEYLSKLSFVNSKKMALQGCSFGGVQTNYLVANTNLFAAACSVVGFSNWTSVSGALIDGIRSEQDYFENGQSRIGKSLWEVPGQYLKNSAILNAHMVTTPLLMMNNKEDGIIPYYDAIAFFTGLRRMGKRAWLLSYPNGGHGVFNHDADDFSIRMLQFFDHYLKDKPAPVWMTRGIPASKKGLDNGLEYDTEVKTPGPGLLNNAEQAKVDSLMTRKPITILLR